MQQMTREAVSGYRYSPTVDMDILPLYYLFCPACAVEQYLLLLKIKPFRSIGRGRNIIQMNYIKELMETLIWFGSESGLSIVA